MDLAQLHPAFAAKLAKRKPLIDAEVTWPGVRLRQLTYIGKIICPTELVSSAQAVIFQDARVLVVRRKDGSRHIVTGGLLKRGETIDATVRRELLEQTGWRVRSLIPFGVHHFSALDEPERFEPPLGDFLQLLFVTETYFYQRSERDQALIPPAARLTPVREARGIVPPLEAALLRAASRRRPKTIAAP